MISVILATAMRYLLPLLLLFSIFLLMRGHNDPGGGFVGGLVAASSLAMYALSYGVSRTRYLLRVNPQRLIGVGLLIAVSSAIASMVFGRSFMTSVWSDFEIPAIGSLGTPMFFDIGVYIVVVGVVLLIIFSLAEEPEAVQEAEDD